MGKGPAASVRFPNRMAWPECRRWGWKQIRAVAGPFVVVCGFLGGCGRGWSYDLGLLLARQGLGNRHGRRLGGEAVP